MRRFSLLILAILSITFLLLLTPYILNPELYTLSNDSSTSYHSNPAALYEYSYERSEEIQGMMQELLDAPQPIVLNLKIKDFEEAERLFEEYKEKSKDFNRVVVNLDLTESAIADFQRENRKNMDALERILNDSATFDEINRLEVKYRSENNPNLLYTVVVEGEAVQKALEKTTTQFEEREPDILALSAQLGLNTTQYLEAVGILKDIVETDKAVQEERKLNQPSIIAGSLSLSVFPLKGQYKDTLRVAGAYTFSSDENVTLVLDSRDWKILTPDKNGAFFAPLFIERIREGEHVIFATTGRLYSNLVTFTVIPTNTTLTLQVYSSDERWDEVYVYGKLFTGELPVSAAPVRILVDDFEAVTFTTYPEGYYYGSINLTKGNHTLQAVFDDPSFPLNPSESEIQVVSLTSMVPLLVAIGVGAGVLLLASLGSIWYLKRKGPGPVNESDEPPTSSDQQVLLPVSKQPALPSLVDILIQYQALFNGGDHSGAAAVLYRALVDRMIPLPEVNDPYALTAREFARRVSLAPSGEAFRLFVSRYEEVRYGGMPLLPQDLLLTRWNAVLAVLEEGHE